MKIERFPNVQKKTERTRDGEKGGRGNQPLPGGAMGGISEFMGGWVGRSVSY